jgi:hypothetical protein
MAADKIGDSSSQEQRREVSLRRQPTSGWVRIGILALPLSGVLTLVGLLSRYGMLNPRVDAEAAAQSASSNSFIVGQFVGNILGLTLLIFGLLALTAYLANTRARGLALTAMVLSIAGIALILSALGVTTYALPLIGRAYLSGQEDAITIADAIFNAPAREIFVPIFLLYSAGFILFGIAIWRCGVLRKGSAIALGIHAPLFASFIRPQPTVGTIIVGLLFILGGAMVASRVFRRPFAEEEARVKGARVR